jgi:putative holliday junction resolvase
MAKPAVSNTTGSIMALDVGERRIGVALAGVVARLPRPLVTLTHDANIWSGLEALIEREAVSIVVVGLPRNLQGDDTLQTAFSRQFAAELAKRITVPVHLQDEALTSHKAEAELRRHGKPYTKGDIDALAATYILEDYLAQGVLQ